LRFLEKKILSLLMFILILILSLSLSFATSFEGEILFGSIDDPLTDEEQLFPEHIVSSILDILDEPGTAQPSLVDQIRQVESELESNRIQIEQLKLRQYVKKRVADILSTVQTYRSPPGSPRVPFAPSEKFDEIQSTFYELMRSLEKAESITVAKSAIDQINRFLKSIDADPQIIWNASKGFVLSRSRTVTDQVRLASKLLASEKVGRELQRKRAQLVFQRAQEVRNITHV
jgi:hypothetical protein